MAERNDEFYVGYKPQAPPGLARRIRRIVPALLLVGAGCAALLASFQSRFAESDFEYGNVRSFAGRLSASPYPALEVDQPEEHAGETHLLVALGKKGAEEAVSGLEGRRVELMGQLIHRGEARMVEIVSDEIEDLGPAAEEPEGPRSFGEHRLTGEIVDAKCHLGVMKPGDGKPHRACAARCISGGAPPMLWVRDRAGRSTQYLLVGRDGRPLNAEVLDLVAEPVEARGEVVLADGLWTLRTEPGDIARLDGHER